MKNALTPVKNFVDRNKTAIIVGTVGLSAIVLQRIAINQHNKFLKENGLYEEFYALEELD